MYDVVFTCIEKYIIYKEEEVSVTFFSRMVLNPDDSSLLHQEPGIFCPKSNLHPPRKMLLKDKIIDIKII